MKTTHKLILLNSIIIVLVALISFIATLSATNYSIKQDYQNRLYENVKIAADKLVTNNGDIYVDSDFDFYVNGVYISIYSEDGTYINGIFPDESIMEQKLVNGSLESITIDGDLYYFYDYYINLQARSGIYIRGIINDASSVETALHLTGLIAIPILVLIGVVGTIFVSKSSTKAIMEVCKDADLISSSSDLDRKLDVKTKDRDILALQQSYNDMLRRLVNVFSREEGFISDVSHELRTPLSVLKQECEYAILTDENQEVKSSLKIMSKQIDRMISMVNELLEYSRLSKNETISLEKVNISTLIKDNFIKEDKKVKITYDIIPDIYIMCNTNLFVRMLNNLIDNAIKYNKENGEVVISLASDETHVYLSVRDSGIGISKADIEHIFDRFYQVDKARTISNSLGLGLSFVAEIVRLHKAKIEVVSKEGDGTNFIITFIKP